jgi:hypothetical protein
MHTAYARQRYVSANPVWDVQCETWPCAPGIGIGRDSTGLGNLLLLRPLPGDGNTCGETVWCWNHDGGITKRLADRLVDLFEPGDPEDRAANELLRAHGVLAKSGDEKLG